MEFHCLPPHTIVSIRKMYKELREKCMYIASSIDFKDFECIFFVPSRLQRKGHFKDHCNSYFITDLEIES